MPKMVAVTKKDDQELAQEQDREKKPINNNELLKECKDWPVLQLGKDDWPVLKLEVDLLTGGNEEEFLEARDLEEAIEEEEREEEYCSFRLR